MKKKNKILIMIFQQSLGKWVLKLAIRSYLPPGMFKALYLVVVELSEANVSLLEKRLPSLQLLFVTVSRAAISITFVPLLLILSSSTSITFTKELLFLTSSICVVLLEMSDWLSDKYVGTSFGFIRVVSKI